MGSMDVPTWGNRVVSKHLFNLDSLTGEYDEEAYAFEKNELKGEWKLEHWDKTFENLKELCNDKMPKNYYEIQQTVTAPFLGIMNDRAHSWEAHPKMTEAYDGCYHSQLFCPAKDGNIRTPFRVHTPQGAHYQNEANAALIYIHGGGGVAGDYEDYTNYISMLCIEAGVTGFVVEYRLAPEVQFESCVKDVVHAIKHIVKNCTKFRIDPKRVALGGEGYGGTLAIAAEFMLNEEADPIDIKLLVAEMPNLSDYCFGDTASMTLEEAALANLNKKCILALAGDLEEDKNNHLLYPLKAPHDVLAKLPPTAIFNFEFDAQITDSFRFAAKLRRVGRLVEFRVLKGVGHHHAYLAGTQAMADNLADWSKVIKHYLL